MPELLVRKARTYFSHHLCTKNIRIPRQAISECEQLVIFTDASTLALATAAYAINSQDSGLGPRLIWAKNKLASLRGNETVPRLELGAAVMGTELAFFICKTFGWDLNRVLYFSDSMTILWWMQSTQALNPYVANRLQKIAERSSYRQWLHVKTEVNPADLPTRGIRPERLRERALWWRGPEFLGMKSDLWDEQPLLYETEEAAAERRTLESICRNIVLAVRTAATDRLEVGEFVMEILVSTQSFEKGSRIADLARQAAAKFRRQDRLICDSGTVAIRLEQRQQFMNLKGSLMRGTVPEPRYWTLRPFLDEEGVIRINGRLTPWLECDRERAHPVLLHKSMRLVKVLMWEIHAVQLKHCGGINTLLAKARERYWIIQGSASARETVRNCLFCAKTLARPFPRPLPPLHLSRSGKFWASLRAFQEIGIDFCGPFSVTIGRSQHKRYAMVIACCTTRAVNVEVCHALDGQSCLAALERHCARYAQPRYINSDNGSNFLASARHLETRIAVLRDHCLPEHRRWHPNIEWYFNPPSSPTWTGHVECFVKLVKNALKKLEPRYRQTFTEEGLSTALTMTIGYINSRPLVAVGAENPPLTPASFLLTGSAELHGIPVACPEQLPLSNRKELLDIRLDGAWRSFHQDYLTSLQQRDRVWPTDKRMEVGDHVLILEDNFKTDPRRWRAGKVMKIHPSKDDQERSYDVLVDGEVIFKRNYRSLARLPSPISIPDGHLQELSPDSQGRIYGPTNIAI